MRIALDCRAAFHGMGGIGRYTWSLLKELAALDDENDYLCYFTALPMPERVEFPKRFTVRRFEAGMIDERFDQLILPSLLQEDRADVYHNPTFAVPVVRTPVRTVSTVHDVVFRRHPELVEPRLRNYLDRATMRACKCADRIITVSEFSKQELLSLYPAAASDCTVIHNGVDTPSPQIWTEATAGPVPERLGLERQRYVLYVGSVESKKNIDALIQGFARLLALEPDPALHLAIVGSQNEASYPLERKIAEAGIQKRVRVLGYVEADVLEGLYAHAFAFVYPSFYEGFGFPPLEAMARGVPTIVSDASSLPEVAGDAALLFDPKRPDQLAEALRTLVRDPERRRELALKGRERARRFTWKTSAEKHLELYRTVARVHETASSGL